MKYSITNKRLDDVILNYLNSNLVPDGGWSSKSDYKKTASIAYSLSFDMDDEDGYSYTDGDRLIIEPWVNDKLYSLFNEYWIPVFKKWFEDNTGLKVRMMLYSNSRELIWVERF